MEMELAQKNYEVALIGLILSGILFIVTCISVFCAFKAYQHQRDRAKKEAACTLAEHYAKNILNRVDYISQVFKLSGLEKRVKEVFEFDDMIVFDRAELMSILQNQEIEYSTIKFEMYEIEPNVILNLTRYATFMSKDKAALPFLDIDTGDKDNSDLVKYAFRQEIIKLLNDLECFSMNCKYCIADETLLYQSLHQSFLSTVCLLYFFISDINASNEDKLFTNTIWLYTQWKTRLCQIQTKAYKKKRKAVKKLLKAKMEVAEAEKDVKEAKPEIFSGKPL